MTTKTRCLLLLLSLSIQASSQQTIIPYGSAWKYLDDGSNQGTAWRATAFNDAGWASAMQN